MRRLWAALGGDRRGGAVIEFAILAPVLFTILLGIIEMGRMFYVRQALEYATEEAARYYMLNPTTASSNVTSSRRGLCGAGSPLALSIFNLANLASHSSASAI